MATPVAGPNPPYAELIGFLTATVVLLVLDVWTARRGQRRTHVTLALTTVPVFLTAVHFAGAVGKFWIFDPTWLAVHLSFAITGYAMAFVTVLAGIGHLAGKLSRVVHKRIAYTFLMLVVLASSTGVMIFVTGRPKPVTAGRPK